MKFLFRYAHNNGIADFIRRLCEMKYKIQFISPWYEKASGNVAYRSNESPRLTSRCTLAKKNEITQKGEVLSGGGGRGDRRGGFFEESQFPLVETDNDPLPTTEYT